MSISIRNIPTSKQFIINRSVLQRRFDAPAHRKAYCFYSEVYPNVRLSEIAYINPTTSFLTLKSDEEIVFVPMEAINEEYGIIDKPYIKKVKDSKGFTRFKRNDLIWAKITPCMQNGKSAVVKIAGDFACGSTEFYIIRPKIETVYVEYLHYLLRDERILNSAQNYFGGSAGQQRVSKEYLVNFNVPLPPLNIQKDIVQEISKAYLFKQTNLEKADLLRKSIDTFILESTDITLPASSLKDKPKYFISSLADLTGSRFDPKLYEQSTRDLKDAIRSSRLKKMPLKTLITYSAAGDWGIDDTGDIVEGYDQRLVVRATEFDNEGNLNLSSSRVQYRLISEDKLKRMDVKPGDLLIEKSGGSPDQPVGRIAFITSDMLRNYKIAYSNFIHKIRVDESKVLPEFLFYFLKTMHNSKLTDAMQSQTNGIRNLIMNNYFTQDIILPDLPTQKRIVRRVREIQTEIDELCNEAEKVLSETKRIIERQITT